VQASDRAHRTICAGTIEGRIDEMIEARRGLAEQIVDRGVETALSELSDQELSELVALRAEA
jgi:SNF2 family DNA or RNA helicase